MQKNYPIEVLHWAGMNDSYLYELKRIIHESPELLNTTSKTNDNALIIASASNNIEMVKYLVEYTDIDQTLVGDSGNAFLAALKHNNTAIALYLAKHSKISIYEHDSTGKSAYHIAAFYGNDDVIQFLLEKEVNINCVDDNLRNCLFYFVDNYTMHNNYVCFDYLEGNMDTDILKCSDKYNYNIIQYIDSLINNSENHIQKMLRIKAFAPLRAILESRFA